MKAEKSGFQRVAIFGGCVAILIGLIAVYIASRPKKPDGDKPQTQVAQTGDRVVRAYPGYWTELVTIPAGSCFSADTVDSSGQPMDKPLDVRVSYSDGRPQRITHQGPNEYAQVGKNVSALEFRAVTEPVDVYVKFR